MMCAVFRACAPAPLSRAMACSVEKTPRAPPLTVSSCEVEEQNVCWRERARMATSPRSPHAFQAAFILALSQPVASACHNRTENKSKSKTIRQHKKARLSAPVFSCCREPPDRS